MFGLRERGPQGRVIALACTLLVTSACGDKEEGGEDTGTYTPPAVVPDGGTGSTTTVHGGGAQTAIDSGTPPVLSMDSGTTRPPATTEDAAPAVVSADTGVATSDASVEAGDASVEAGLRLRSRRQTCRDLTK